MSVLLNSSPRPACSMSGPPFKEARQLDQYARPAPKPDQHHLLFVHRTDPVYRIVANARAQWATWSIRVLTGSVCWGPGVNSEKSRKSVKMFNAGCD